MRAKISPFNDQLAAAVGEDRRSAGETCALLLAALGRGAPESEAVSRHVEENRDATAAERVANQDRQRTERSEVIPRGEKCRWRGRLGAGNRPRQSAELLNEPRLPPNYGQGELSLTREGGWRSLLRKDGVEIGNSG